MELLDRRREDPRVAAKKLEPPASAPARPRGATARGSRRRARSSVAAAPPPSSAAATHLTGFLVRAVEPRESSILHYSSLATPGTHTEYHVAVADALAGARWVVARRFSAFLLLRDELLRGLSLAPHCALCAALRVEVAALARALPRRRLWGSSRPAVVRRRADKLLAFLRALLALATNAALLRCPVVCFGFAVQVRSFLTRDGEPAPDARALRPLRPLAALAIREGDADDDDTDADDDNHDDDESKPKPKQEELEMESELELELERLRVASAPAAAPPSGS